MTTINEYLEEEPILRSAVVCYIREDDKVLLGVRKISSTGLGVNRIAGIGGKFEEGENAQDALLREIREEVGLELIEFEEMGRVRFLFPFNTKWDQDVTVFVGTKWNGVPIASDEIEPTWFSINELPVEKMFTDNKLWVPQVLNGKRVEAIFLYDENHQVIDSKIEFFDKGE